MKLKEIFSTLQEIEGEKVFVASTDAVDRHGEVMNQDGWDLANFKKHPILLAYHDQENPIGYTAIGFKTVNGKKTLIHKPEFHGQTETSKLYKWLTDNGYPLATSVGFIPKEYDGNTITKAELLEISIVSVPANQEALTLAYSKGFDKDTCKKAFTDFDKVDKEYQETENLKKENEELKKQIESLQTKQKSDEENGREPKLDTQINLAMKAANIAMQKLNKLQNERNKQ